MIILSGLGLDTMTSSGGSGAPSLAPAITSPKPAAGAAYTCGLRGCYGLTPARVSELKQIQATINVLAPVAKLPVTPTNGVITGADLTRLGAVLARLGVSMPGTSSVFGTKPSPSTVAAGPQPFLQALQAAHVAYVAYVARVNAVKPPAPAAQPGAGTQVTVTASVVDPPAPPAVVPSTTAPPAAVSVAPQPGAGTQVTVEPAPPSMVSVPSSGKWKLWAAIGGVVVAAGVGVLAVKHGG